MEEMESQIREEIRKGSGGSHAGPRALALPPDHSQLPACPPGFAELQTDMTDLTKELNRSQGIPFLEYKHFVTRTFFPKVSASSPQLVIPQEFLESSLGPGNLEGTSVPMGEPECGMGPEQCKTCTPAYGSPAPVPGCPAWPAEGKAQVPPPVPTFFLCSLDIQVCLRKAAVSPAFLRGCWACLSSHRGAILSPSLPPVHWTPSPPFHASSCCSRGRCPVPTLLSLSGISLQVAPPSWGPRGSLSALSPSTLSCFSFLLRVCAPSLPPLDFSLVLLFLQEAPLGFPSPGVLGPLGVAHCLFFLSSGLVHLWGSPCVSRGVRGPAETPGVCSTVLLPLRRALRAPLPDPQLPGQFPCAGDPPAAGRVEGE